MNCRLVCLRRKSAFILVVTLTFELLTSHLGITLYEATQLTENRGHWSHTANGMSCQQATTLFLSQWHYVNLCDAIVANDCTNLWSRKRERSRSGRASLVRHNCWGREHRGRSGKHRDAELDVSEYCWSPATGWWTATLSCYHQPSQARSSPTQTWNVPTPHSAGLANSAWFGSYWTCTWTYTRDDEL